MEGHGRSMRGSGRSVGGQGVVIGDHSEVRCPLPKAMSISSSELLRKKRKEKRPENEKSWKVMGVQWEVIGGQRKVSGRSWEVNEGFWEVSGRSRVVIGDHLEVRCSLPKEMGISRTEIFRKKKKNKNTKCPIDAHCQRHRRKDFRITKDCNELISNFQLFMLKTRTQSVL